MAKLQDRTKMRNSVEVTGGAGYKHIHLSDIEDVAPKFELDEVHEARFATSLLGCKQLGLAHYKVKPNQRPPFGHRHGVQEEIYIILKGSGNMHFADDTTVSFREGDLFRVDPQTARAWEAGDYGAEIIAVGAPALSGGKNDSEILRGVWGD